MGSPLSEQQALILKIIAHVSSLSSILGSLFIILSYLLFKQLRKAHSGLIFWLSVCDFLSSLAYFAIPVEQGKIYCLVQGVAIQFFQIASFIWTASIALALYIVFVRNKSFNLGFGNLAKQLHLFAWLFAAVNVAIGIALNIFGDANYDEPGTQPSWCWIAFSKNLEKFLLYFLPFLVVWMFNVVVYIVVSRTIHKVVKSEQLRGRAFTRMRLYLLVYMLCIGVGAINRTQNFISPDQPIFWLNVLDASISPLQGFLNSLVYGMNKQIRGGWIEALCCFRKNEESEPILSVKSPTQIDGKSSVNSINRRHFLG